MRFAVAPWLLVPVLAAPAVARAQAAPDYAAARRHYKSAEAASTRNDHATAAREYGIAYDITKDPVLFFKLATAFKRSGDCGSALVYFRRYLLEGKPDTSFERRTRAEIAECEADGGAAPVGSDDAPLAPPVASTQAGATTWQKTAAWTSVGLGLGLVTAGAVLALSARSREEDVDNLISYRDGEGRPADFDGATRDRYEDLVEEGDRLDRLSLIAFGAAGVAAGAAVLFFVLDPGAPRRSGPEAGEVSVTPALGEGRLGVQAGWSW